MRLQALRDTLNRSVRDASADPAHAARYRAPILAVASASDPLFSRLRRAVSGTHALPTDLLPGARSVVAFFIPFHPDIPASNRSGSAASAAWARAYVSTNRLIADISGRLASVLQDAGFRSAIIPATHNFDERRLVSDWSHKHAGFIAGLGRFGRHHMLITDAGCAGRIGSLVTDADLPVTSRPRRAFCLAVAGQRCDACVRSCPVGALDTEPFDRRGCYKRCLDNARRFQEAGVAELADVCGKCVAGMPCALRNPTRAHCERPDLNRI